MFYHKHQHEKKGDWSKLEALITSSKVVVDHIDSYLDDKAPRFQGSFHYHFFDPGPDNSGNGDVIKNEAPLEWLKIARAYQFFICDCTCKEHKGRTTTPHVVWTIWFDLELLPK